MSSQPDAPRSVLKVPQYAETEASIVLPRQRSGSPASSVDSLPFRRPNPSLISLFASTALGSSSAPQSARSSGTATPTRRARSGSVFSSIPTNGESVPSHHPDNRPNEPKNVLLRAFAPHVGVLTSTDTEEILVNKGFAGGFLDIIKPYGELVQGKVTVRDSIGASKSFEDFGIRFTGVKDALGMLRVAGRRPNRDNGDSINGRLSNSKDSREVEDAIMATRVGGNVAHIEELVDRHLLYSEVHGTNSPTRSPAVKDNGITPATTAQTSPFYSLYFRRLLSAMPMTPHETFSHPVACVIVISSRNPSPIEELRRLYSSTNTGDDRLPQWVNNEFLRYYVLVHDEDHDDIGKSTQLFEQMKRHFGLHCHLLRLRSSQCIPSDDDSVRLPRSGWVSAAEDLAEIKRRESSEDVEDPTPYLFESDATAIKTFVRELVTQSIIPSMERSIATWNEQVMTRRRGIGGRLMSLSKRWTPFGASSRNSSSPVGLQNSSGSNYDSLQGFYRPDAPEAVMRKLADYAFMLRDFKLASSTYDILRGDFDHDKAWKYYAGANEMAAVSMLLNAQGLSSKSRAENLDRMLEAASHSYIHRCIAPYYALRAISLGVEALKLRGGPAVDDAARWAARTIDYGLTGPIGQTLFTERICVCFAAREGVGGMQWGMRRRKAAFWAMLASIAFLQMGKSIQSEKCLAEAGRLYGLDSTSDKQIQFAGMLEYMAELKESVIGARLASRGYTESAQMAEHEADSPLVEEVSEQLDTRVHRHSLMGAPSPFGPLDAAPLSPVRTMEDPLRFASKDDAFE